MIPYTPPKFMITAFNCPHCNAYANQVWNGIRYSSGDVGLILITDFKIARCVHCNKNSLWHVEKMIYPEDSGVQPPNSDLLDDIKDDYCEAKSIVNKSPRGAAALLRLCIQKLCQQLGEKGENLNYDIANLVKNRLPSEIQQSLDFVRVIGNNAVHPGQIDLKDNNDIAMKLFELINLVADVMITQPKQVKKLYDETLPKEVIRQIKERDRT